MKLLFLDTETAGLDPKINPIIQLSGIIEIIGESIEPMTKKGLPLYKEFDYKIRPTLNDPRCVIDDKALEVNHITREELTNPDRLEPIDAYKKLKSLLLTYVDKYNKLDKLYLVGQNVGFDYGFLLELWKRNGDDYLGSFIHHNKIDLIALTAALKIAGKIDVPNMKLQTLCEYFSLGAQEHDALSDIRKTREVFLRMVGALGKSNLCLLDPEPR